LLVYHINSNRLCHACIVSRLLWLRIYD